MKKGELGKLLLPRLLSSATHVKVKKFKRILGYYNANFRCDALLLFLILLGEANFKCWQANQCTSNKAKVKLTILHSQAECRSCSQDRQTQLAAIFPEAFTRAMEEDE